MKLRFFCLNNGFVSLPGLLAAAVLVAPLSFSSLLAAIIISPPSGGTTATVSVSSSPRDVTVNKPVSVSWRLSASTSGWSCRTNSVYGSSGWSNQTLVGTAGSKSVTFSSAGPKTLSVTCSRSGISVSGSSAVTVSNIITPVPDPIIIPKPPVVITPSSIALSSAATSVKVNSSVNVSWRISSTLSDWTCKTNSVSGTSGWSNLTFSGVSGSRLVTFTSTGSKTLTATCSRSGSSDIAGRLTFNVVADTSTTPPPTAGGANPTFYPNTDWVSGRTVTVSWNASAFSSNVDVWICTQSNYSKNTTVAGAANTYCNIKAYQNLPNTGSYSLSYSGNPGRYYFYVRKYGDWPNTYSGNGFSGPITLVAVPDNGLPAVFNAYLGGSIYNQPSSISFGDQVKINGSFKNFDKTVPVDQTLVATGGANINAIAVNLCDPAGGNCTPFPGSRSNMTRDGAVYYYMLAGQKNGSFNFTDLTDASKVQSFLNKPKVVSICPLAIQNVNNRQYYSIPSGVTCSRGSSFVVSDPNHSNSSTWNIPTGQGCWEGECICENGQAKRCGNPVKPGTGCPATPWCTKGPTAFTTGRLLGAAGVLFDQIYSHYK